MKPKLDFIGIGGIAYDLVLRVESLPGEDGKYPASTYQRLPGGLVANATCAAARLGLRCGFVGWIGKDSGGELLLEDFQQYGIDVGGMIKIAAAETPFTIILVDKDGQRAILLPPFELYNMRFTDKQIQYTSQGAMLYTNFRSIGWCLDVATMAAKSRRTFALDVEVHNDFTQETLLKVASLTDIIFLSPGILEKANLESIHQIQNKGWVIITKGAQGVSGMQVGDTMVYEQPAFKVLAIDTTGAGDVFHAACIAAYQRKLSLPDALRFASAAAAIAVQGHGARGKLPNTDDVDIFLEAYPK